MSESALSYYGLKNNDEEFELGDYLLECMNQFNQNKEVINHQSRWL